MNNQFARTASSPTGAAEQTSAAQRVVFEHLLLVITFLLIFIMAARTPLDTDMWWHLSAGDEMLRSGQILLTDVFSFTRTGAPWTNVSWLCQVGMAVIYHWQGYLGLSAAVALLAVFSMGLVSLQCEGPALFKTTALLLGSIVASVVWSPRPQLISLLFIALTSYLLYLYKRRGKDVLWVLPLVFIAWGNMHGGYPLGLILIGAMIGGEVLNHLLAVPGKAVLSWRKIFRLASWGVLCGLAVLISPSGLKTWLLPFQTVDMQVLQQFIPEWASPDFHILLEQSLLWLLLATFAAVALSGQDMDGSDLLVLLGFAFMALLARRNFGPFALVAVPILCRYGTAALESWQVRASWILRFTRRAEDDQRGKRVKKALNLLIVALLGAVALLKLYGVSHPVVVNGYLTQGYPARAVVWIKENRPAGRVLNEYNWGGYMQWALRGYPIFVDGRTDIFNDEIVRTWMDTIQAVGRWEATLDQYQVDLVMLQPDRPLLKKLDETGWKWLYADTQVVIYGR
jgi:hypothetical protein